MKKKILFSAYTLDVGGIETALVSLLNNLIDRYDITLVLEKKQGIFLERLDSRIKIIEYNPNQNKNSLIRKSINLMKRIKFIAKYKNKYDFAASFATYSKMGSFCARTASKNNALWGHLDYTKLFKNKDEMREFFNFVKYNKFLHIIFVSEEGANSFKGSFPDVKNKVIVCNNLIDYNKIIKMAEQKININKENITTFLNVGRHEEKQKRLSRIIEAAKELKNSNLQFRILLVGDGPDTEKYKKMVLKYELEENIIFCGRKDNPYPYFNIADCIILSSEYEGYPVVFVEALTLNKPIITTNVSDAKIDIENKYGIVAEKNSACIYEAMKKIIEEGYKISNRFNPEEFNASILEKLEKIIDGGSNAKN